MASRERSPLSTLLTFTFQLTIYYYNEIFFNWLEDMSGVFLLVLKFCGALT